MPEHSHQGHRGSAPSAQEMEERYRATAQVWSGSPNATLVDHVSDLPAGTALDIGYTRMAGRCSASILLPRP